MNGALSSFYLGTFEMSSNTMPPFGSPGPDWEENLYTKGWRRTYKSGDFWVTQVLIWDSSSPEESGGSSWVVLRKGKSSRQEELPEVWETQELDPNLPLDLEKIPC